MSTFQFFRPGRRRLLCSSHAGEPIQQPHSAYHLLPQPSWWLCALASAACLLLIAPGWRRRSLALLLLLPLLWAAPSAPRNGALQVWFFDVGQGQSVLLQTASHRLLYDAGAAWSGGFDAGERVVLPALKQLQVEALDALVISHADQDHAGGAAAIEAALPVQQRWGSGGEACQLGIGWRWDGVDFAFLHPAGGRWSDNNSSCVLQVRTAHGRSLLLTGDIEADVESLLLQQGLSAQDLISVPHHGSGSSSSAAFVEALRPQLAVVSAGYQNRWGHPLDEVVQRYRHSGTRLWSTAEQGAIRVELGDELKAFSWRQDQPRLWRTFSPPDAR